MEQCGVWQLRKFQVRKFMFMKNNMSTYENPTLERIKTFVSFIMRGITKENTSSRAES